MMGGPDDPAMRDVWVQTEASAFDPVNSHRKVTIGGLFYWSECYLLFSILMFLSIFMCANEPNIADSNI